MDIKIQFAFYPLYVTYNNGIALLSAMCKEKGIETELYVLDDVNKYKDFLNNSDASMVGFSCVTEEDYFKSLPFIITAVDAGREVLLGGVYARRKANLEIKGCRICHGDGETLPMYILNRKDDMLFKQPFLHEDLNILPLPDYEMFRDIPFDRDFVFVRDKNVLPYHSSRGCIHNCSFCEIRLQQGNVKIRTKVEEDLAYLKNKYNPDIFYISDALPPVYSKPWKESWGNFRHPFISYIRADFNKEQLNWLIDRGMIGALFGIESGDEEYRNAVLKKNLSDDDIWKTIELLTDSGVNYVAFFMDGAPDETHYQKKLTQKMIDKIKEIGGYTIMWNYKRLTGA